jgi:hypothetical protein
LKIVIIRAIVNLLAVAAVVQHQDERRRHFGSVPAGIFAVLTEAIVGALLRAAAPATQCAVKLGETNVSRFAFVAPRTFVEVHRLNQDDILEVEGTFYAPARK